MIVKILAIGKLREKYWQDGVADYSRRLRPYCQLVITEVPETRVPENASPAEEKIAMAHEAEAILARLKNSGVFVVVLDRNGKSLDSLELADWITEQILDGRGEIIWIIGGPLGLDQSVLDRANLVLSFSKFTFPHQMMRLILLEQIYRSFRIIGHEPYHK